MHTPKVSIILPIYNVEEYLEECLESVTRQTLHDIEIICVNDGSKDGSLTVVNRYANRDERIVVLDGPNGGYGKAMNKGLQRATGEYIGIVEPDDFVALTMYEDLYVLASSYDLDFIKADFYRFTRDESENMQLRYERLDRTHTHYDHILDPSTHPEFLTFVMNTWSGIYKHAFIEEHRIRHNETPGASFQDNGFWFQTFAYAKRAMIVDRPYYRNRRDNPNSSVKDSEKVYCMNDEYDHIEQILRQDEQTWARFKYMFWRRRYDNYSFTLKRIDPAFKKDYYVRFKADFQRAHDLEELDRSLFENAQWRKLERILSDPAAAYRSASSREKARVALGNAYHLSKKGASKAKQAAKRLLG